MSALGGPDLTAEAGANVILVPALVIDALGVELTLASQLLWLRSRVATIDNRHCRLDMPLLPGIDEPGWYVITDSRTGQTEPFDGDRFYKTLAAVSDYEL